MKYAKKVDEEAKILALKSIMPETLFGEAGVFRRRSFNLHADLRTVIINDLDDKSASVNDEAESTKIKNEHGSDFGHKRSRKTGRRRRDEK